jgi:NADP-dependent 3-hydroxy acid dehydrogenase YdfG
MTSPPVVAITGASAGVGRATAVAFARTGASIGLLARGEAGLKGASDDVEANGGRALALPTDVADAEQVDAAADQIEDAFGPVDIWVNNAMASVFARVQDVTADEFRRVTEVTYLSYVYGTLAALRSMLPRDAGTIVQVGSALAWRGIPLQSAYCGSKHAIQGFVDSLRSELLADGSNVRVTQVDMPALNTPQFGWVRTRLPNHPQPVPPIYAPEIAADAIVWAAEHAPRTLNVGLPTVLTKLGNRVSPALLDWYLSRSGIQDQQTDEPIDHDRWQDNLDAPVDDDRDYGADGVFGDRAKTFSPQLWLAKRKPQVAGAVGALAGAAGLLALGRGRR